jgi:hypothetical protein
VGSDEREEEVARPNTSTAAAGSLPSGRSRLGESEVRPARAGERRLERRRPGCGGGFPVLYDRLSGLERPPFHGSCVAHAQDCKRERRVVLVLHCAWRLPVGCACRMGHWDLGRIHRSRTQSENVRTGRAGWLARASAVVDSCLTRRTDHLKFVLVRKCSESSCVREPWPMGTVHDAAAQVGH